MTEKLFETALGIRAPWYVAGADFNAQARTLTIRVDFASGSRFAVPGVDGEHPVHDTVCSARLLDLLGQTFGMCRRKIALEGRRLNRTQRQHGQQQRSPRQRLAIRTNRSATRGADLGDERCDTDMCAVRVALAFR